MSDGKTAWITNSKAQSTPWGEETRWSGGSGGSLVKTLLLAKGKRTSFKYNKVKDEMLICGTGKVKAYYADEELITLDAGDLRTGVLEPGSALIVQPGCPYRLEALEDSTILEVSAGHSGDASRVRLHDDFGRPVAQCTKYMQKVINKWFQN